MTSGISANPEAIGFNRYMVECEFKTWLHNTTGIRVLIDTWWNVNSGFSSDASTVILF